MRQLRKALTEDLIQLTMIVQTHFFMAQSLQPDQHETAGELVNAIWDMLSLAEPSLGCILPLSLRRPINVRLEPIFSASDRDLYTNGYGVALQISNESFPNGWVNKILSSTLEGKSCHGLS